VRSSGERESRIVTKARGKSSQRGTERTSTTGESGIRGSKGLGRAKKKGKRVSKRAADRGEGQRGECGGSTPHVERTQTPARQLASGGSKGKGAGGRDATSPLNRGRRERHRHDQSRESEGTKYTKALSGIGIEAPMFARNWGARKGDGSHGNATTKKK